MPVLAGPPFYASDTDGEALGAADVCINDALWADDQASNRLAWVLVEPSRLFDMPAPDAAVTAVLVGERTPRSWKRGRQSVA